MVKNLGFSTCWEGDARQGDASAIPLRAGWKGIAVGGVLAAENPGGDVCRHGGCRMEIWGPKRKGWGVWGDGDAA